uniref:Homer protein n=1 Tax=Cannabis sativa TaxID=3483 RepID=A0A803NZL9_CANSA
MVPHPMVELQSCASLVNTSALCAIEQEVKGESANVIAQISAELQKERQKNAELMKRISFLEAQIQERTKEYSLCTNLQGSCATPRETNFKKFKKQKIEAVSNGTDTDKTIKNEDSLEKNQEAKCLVQNDQILENRLVNWMSMDETQFLQFEKVKDGDSTADCDDTDESDDEEDDYHEEHGINNDHSKEKEANEITTTSHIVVIEPSNEELPETQHISSGLVSDQFNVIRDYKSPQTSILNMGRYTNCYAGSGSISHSKKPPKVAFCPREVKRIIVSEALEQKNAQSHTIRKIIVFASLGIRHGCEDMYELDFNHFSILKKGEPYESPSNPGEHVLYENPQVRRKVFYPNRQNPTLCPIQVLEEEKAMRPSDSSCPSCLFLCIKYGGRTRNLPQNEYVRQRMGRNKLKSFGPLICRMAMLAHVRSGSFFFKALGITLLFMAGFPDDLVQRETKYRNLDLLQKYYRTDEEAEGEELFLQHPIVSDSASPGSQQLTGKTCSTKPKPTNPFVPALMYWPPPNTYPPATPYTPTYGYHQSFPSAGNYISIHPQPYYTPLIPKIVEGDPKIDTGLKDDANDSDSSSSSTEPKKD